LGFDSLQPITVLARDFRFGVQSRCCAACNRGEALDWLRAA